MSKTRKTAALLLIGNELLNGRTTDKNLPYIASGLFEKGIELVETRIVADMHNTLVSVIKELSANYDYVLTTGGIGPTHDDITAECVAEACGSPLILHPEALAKLEQHYAPEPVNDSRKRMARIPQGASLIPNPVSSAPGFVCKNVYVMAGVPIIMQAMFDHIIEDMAGSAKAAVKTLIFQRSEGDIADDLRLLQKAHPDCDIGSYPFMRDGKIGTSLVVKSDSAQTVNTVITVLQKLANTMNVGSRLVDGFEK